MSNYPYLNDKNFLKKLDVENHKIQFTRISVLHFSTEEVIASIEGKATGGSVNINGSSTMRRTASCSLLVDPKEKNQHLAMGSVIYGDITEINNLISINKKIKLETGFINTLANLGEGYYPQYDIIWFPLGVYAIKSANVSKNNSGINISLTLHDKSVFLNGDAGGIIPAATVFSEQVDLAAADKINNTKKILIKDIIRKLVVEFGGESPDNVIIDDVPDTVRQLMKWTGDTPGYLTTGGVLVLEHPADLSEIKYTFQKGDIIGYMPADFVYPGTLECNAGETVAAMLDKIKNTLGNYEWFYDLDGRFHFQEIKNYLNNSKATEILALTADDYLSVANMSKSVYAFDETNKNLITSISNAPQYQNMKNDFIIWGNKKTISGSNKPIRYHLAFDRKPPVNQNKEYFGMVQSVSEYNETFIPLYLISQDGHKKNTEIYTNTLPSLNGDYYYLVRKWKEKSQKEE